MNVQIKQKRDYTDYKTVCAERGMKKGTGCEDIISEGMRLGLRDEYKSFSAYYFLQYTFPVCADYSMPCTF